MNRLDEMETFVAIADAESLTGASNRQGIALSAVSRRLRDLETRLGVTLFQRSTRHISLTTAGHEFLQRSRQILDDVREAENATGDGARSLTGRIRIAAPLTFSTLHLGPIFFEFMEDHPKLDVEIDLNDRQVDLVAEGFDLAVRIGQLADSSLIARRLTPIRHFPCAAPALLERIGNPSRPEDLARYPTLTYRSVRKRTAWDFERPDGSKGSVRVNGRLAANNGEILQMAAVEGLGVSLEPSFIAFHDIVAKRLVPLFVDHVWSDNSAYAVFPTTRSVPRRVRVLIDFLAKKLTTEPEWDKAIAAAKLQ